MFLANDLGWSLEFTHLRHLLLNVWLNIALQGVLDHRLYRLELVRWLLAWHWLLRILLILIKLVCALWEPLLLQFISLKELLSATTKLLLRILNLSHSRCVLLKTLRWCLTLKVKRLTHRHIIRSLWSLESQHLRLISLWSWYYSLRPL